MNPAPLRAIVDASVAVKIFVYIEGRTQRERRYNRVRLDSQMPQSMIYSYQQMR